MENDSGSPEKIVGQRLAKLRSDRGWSQAQLATAMKERGFGWTQSSVWKTENSSRPIRVNELVVLAELFGTDPGGLLPESDPSDERAVALRASVKASQEASRAERRYKEAQSDLGQAKAAWEDALRRRKQAADYFNSLQEDASRG